MPAAALPRQDSLVGCGVYPKKEVIFWIRFLSGPAEVCPKRKEKNLLALKKECSVALTPTVGISNSVATRGGGVFDTVGNTAAEAFFEYGVPYLAKQGVRQGRYFASEFLREPEYQKKLANKAKPIARKAVNYTIDALSGDLLNKASNKLRPKDMIPGRGKPHTPMVKGGCHNF